MTRISNQQPPNKPNGIDYDYENDYDYEGRSDDDILTAPFCTHSEVESTRPEEERALTIRLLSMEGKELWNRRIAASELQIAD